MEKIECKNIQKNNVYNNKIIYQQNKLIRISKMEETDNNTRTVIKMSIIN